MGIGVRRLSYADYAVVVPRGSLYSVNSYTGVTGRQYQPDDHCQELQGVTGYQRQGDPRLQLDK